MGCAWVDGTVGLCDLEHCPWPKAPLDKEWEWILQKEPFWRWLGLDMLWLVLAAAESLLQRGDDVRLAMAGFTLSFQVHTILKPKAQIVEGMSQSKHARSIFQSLCKLQLVGFAQPYLVNLTTKHILHLWAQASNGVAASASKTPPCTPLTQEAALIIPTINISESPQQRLRLPVRHA